MKDTLNHWDEERAQARRQAAQADCAPTVSVFAELHAALISATAYGIGSVPHIRAQDALYRYQLGMVAL